MISVGGVGFDINCGVRALRTNLTVNDVKTKIRELVDVLFRTVPAGLGSTGKIKLSMREIDEMLIGGGEWAVEQGYGLKEDLEYTEERGKVKGANPANVSEKAKKRQISQIGTLGSGNHYLEIQRVDQIFDSEVANVLGLEKDQIIATIHCGSRALGHQIGTDYLKILDKASRKYGIKIRDRELVCAPINSEEGKRYFSAVCAGINCAFANRQAITHLTRQGFKKVFPDSEVKVLYGIGHNTCKIEKHEVNGKTKELYVHRKGSTRSFGPGREELPTAYKKVGQPTLIGGTMGTYSFILHGTEEGMKKSFGSACFTGNTKILTDKGIIELKDVYERFKKGERFLVPSINKESLEVEWKPIIDTMKRKSKVIEVSISQTGRSKLSKLRTTPDHNFMTIESGKVSFKPVSELIKNDEMVCLLDELPTPIIKEINPNLSFLMGALVSDGYIRANDRHGSTMFIQKKVMEKLSFIKHVQFCFNDVFNEDLKEKRTKTHGGYIRGNYMEGTATEFICAQKTPALQLLKITNNLPVWTLQLNIESALNFLAGVIDGDGTWNPTHNVINVFTGNEDVASSVLIACLKLGILPYISKQRKSCFIIQISERIPLILNYTKRVRGNVRKQKYGTKLFSARQLFGNEWGNTKWPFLHKAERKNLMSNDIILRHIHKYPKFEKKMRELVNSPLRMQRVKKLRDCRMDDVFNITVESNHNYVVFTDTFMPILVKNCHGAGRRMSRRKAKRQWWGENVVKELEKRGMIIKAHSMAGVAEEAPGAYKDVIEVVDSVHNAGISKRVVMVRPLASIKG